MTALILIALAQVAALLLIAAGHEALALAAAFAPLLAGIVALAIYTARTVMQGVGQ